MTLNLYRPFVTTESITWFFFIFHPSKNHVSPTDVVSSFFTPQWHPFFGWYRLATVPCRTSFSWNQDKLVASISSSGNASYRHLTCRVKIKALNPHHRSRPPSTDHPTLTCTVIKRSFQSYSLSSPLNRVSTYHRRLTPIVSSHNDTYSDELADSLSLLKKLIDM
jgi:hypothetical protein